MPPTPILAFNYHEVQGHWSDIAALGPAIVPSLAAYLDTHPDSQCAVEALGKIGGPDALAALSLLAAGGCYPSDVRRAAIRAIADIAAPVPPEPDPEPEAIDEDESYEMPRRSKIVRIITFYPDASVIARMDAEREIDELLAAGYHIDGLTGEEQVTVLLTKSRRRPGSSRRRHHATAVKHPPVTTHPNGRHDNESTPTIIIDQRPASEPVHASPMILDVQPLNVSYADALRAPAGTYTPDQLKQIADQEAFDAAREGYERAKANSPYTDAINRLRSWRPTAQAVEEPANV